MCISFCYCRSCALVITTQLCSCSLGWRAALLMGSCSPHASCPVCAVPCTVWYTMLYCFDWFSADLVPVLLCCLLPGAWAHVAWRTPSRRLQHSTGEAVAQPAAATILAEAVTLLLQHTVLVALPVHLISATRRCFEAGTPPGGTPPCVAHEAMHEATAAALLTLYGAAGAGAGERSCSSCGGTAGSIPSSCWRCCRWLHEIEAQVHGAEVWLRRRCTDMQQMCG